MKILIVEDDAKIASFMSGGFRQAGFTADCAADGKVDLQMALTDLYDAAVIDIMLPHMDGLSLIEELRRSGINTPVIVLSAKRSVDERIEGLRAGGDDYMVKPFAFSELLARARALHRRAAGGGTVKEKVEFSAGNLSMNLLSREVARNGELLGLQAREFSLLELLMRNAGRVVSKTMILERVWDYSFDPQTNVVDVLVCRLRNKVDRNFDEKMIHTIRGVGYVLRAN